MHHRIRAAALVIKENRVLLVEHKHPETGKVWWCPPGGGLENGESILDCVRREVFEESGLSVEPGRIVYVREFVDLEWNRHNLELFLVAPTFAGNLTIDNNQGIDAAYIKRVCLLDRYEMEGLTVYPEILKDGFWGDLQNGFPETRYLGLQRG